MTQLTREKLIKAALRQIVFEGWTARAFEAAEKAEGWEVGTYGVYFPGGTQDFVRAFQSWVDEKMRDTLARDTAFETAKVREKIFSAVMARLHVMAPYREAARRLYGRQLLPWNKPLALAGMARAADAMWKVAGDRSVDYNYYTKRLLLSGVYASTLHAWFTDESEGYVRTQDFLKRRIENVLKFGAFVNSIKTRLGSRKAA